MAMKTTIVALALVSAWVGFGGAADGGGTPAAGERAAASVDEAVGRQMNEAGIVGLGAAVIVRGEVVWSKGYGLADRATGRAFTTDTVMNVGSIAKTVVGVAMMQAVAEGKLSLDEDVNAYLPFRVVNPRYPGEKITLRHLATHVSSIADRREVYLGTYHYGADSPEALGAFLERYFVPGGELYSAQNFVDAKPGAVREYSNIGAALAGFIVERAAGARFNEVTRDRIFRPLGMERTGWFLSEVDLGQHSKLYVSQNGLVIPIELYGCTTYPDGGLRTSVNDLSKLFAALMNGGAYRGVRVLESGAAREMTRFQFTDANRPENLPAGSGNSGLFWRTKFNGRRVGHGGSDPGIHAEMLCDPGHEMGVVLLVNTSLGGEEQEAVAKVFEAVWAHGEGLKRGLDGAGGK